MDFETLGDRMKFLEGIETERRFMPLLPIVARLDGRCFHNFTMNMDRPYDKKMVDLMIACSEYMVEETNACMGYTQSDEISLVMYTDDLKSQLFFDGRVFKLSSVLAAMLSVKFNQLLPQYFPDLVDKMPVFDCRVWTVPTLGEAVNAILWRELDATKNSISQAARAYFSHKQLMNKNGSEMQEMLFSQKQINWNDYSAFFKRGTYVQRRRVVRKFTTEEIGKLPPKHEARMNPDLMVERSEVKVLAMPPLNKVINRVDVFFKGAEPELSECI